MPSDNVGLLGSHTLERIAQNGVSRRRKFSCYISGVIHDGDIDAVLVNMRAGEVLGPNFHDVSQGFFFLRSPDDRREEGAVWRRHQRWSVASG